MYRWLPPDIELMSDTSADWVVSRLRPWDRDRVRVASFMPDVFDAYARILHPAGLRGGERQGLRWSEVASRLGKQLHPEGDFWDLVGGPDTDLYDHPVLDDIEPSSGTLPFPLLRSLVEILSRRSEQEQLCWFATWDGWGNWGKHSHGGPDPFREERDAVLTVTPRVHAPARDHFLMRGPLQAVSPLREAAAGQTPSLWWPEDRSWLVSTDVDAFSTYIGGPKDLIEELLNSDEVEALPSRSDAPLDEGV